MPTYTHRCDKCGREVDIRCSIADRDAPKPCKEHCKKSDTCDQTGTLQRPDGELELTARTPYGWRP